MASRFLLALCLSSHVVFAALPQVDFDRMGKVGLAGAFAGLDLFHNSSIPFDPTASTILSRASDGALTRLASTNQAGSVLAGCALDGTFYLGGSFSSIAGTSASNIASYTSSSGAFAPLGSNGPNGPVNAIFCDAKDGKVWVGGNFTSPGSSVAVWDIKSSLWQKPPFVGLSGPVLSITTNSSDASLFFAGSFITSFQDGAAVALNGTNNPNVPFSPGATPYSSALVPVPLQQAQVDGSPSSINNQFSNIKTILCPSGPDGPGNTWFAADGNEALVTVRTFTFMSIRGIRLGNTFLNGSGTSSFSVTTIPYNTLETLQYLDFATGQTRSCSNCPLSTDSSIPYQDFLFGSTLAITGVQITLSQYFGAAPGLHLLQLLSSGAFASSIDSNNGQSCFASNPSNTTRTGNWVAKVANTDIPGTIQTVLVSTVAVGTSPTSGPSFTWLPDVYASGNYDVNLLVPGCTNFQDCPLRTTVKVTVFPGQGLQPSVSIVSQQNPADATVLVYSGPISSSSPYFVPTISMTLADNSAGTGQGGMYELVADRVQMVLKSVGNPSSNASSGSNPGSVQGTRNGFGFIEWPRSLNVADSSNDGTKVLPNTSMTSLDAVGFDLFNGIRGNSSFTSSKRTALSAVAHHPSGAIFLGGDFTLSSGAANIVTFKDGNLVANMGLNGPVTSLLLDGDQLFVGGAFNDTTSGSFGGKLRSIAMYDVQKGVWTPLGAGLNGYVTSLGLVNRQIQVTGNFTQLSSTSTAGFAVWDIRTSAWVGSGGFLVGSLTFVGNATSSTQIIAGNVVASQKFGASGMIILQNGDSNGPKITPLGAQLDGYSGQATLGSSLGRRRSHIPRATQWISHVKFPKFFARQVTSTQLPPLPPALPAPAPAVLAGIFWVNNSIEVAIIGGNFSFSSPGSSIVSEGVAVYDPASANLKGLSGPQINGTVLSLLVYNSQLFVGGEFSIPGTNANGLAIYDLVNQRWDVNGIQPLQSNPNGRVTVRSITKSSSKPDTIVVAGTFAQAGALTCQSICGFDTVSKQWNAFGQGIEGEVASVAYAGNSQELLIASGSIALPGNSISNVVQFSFPNTTWTALGTPEQLPGPITAVEVNGGNASSIFAAGRSLDGTSAFLSFWNGLSWSTLGSAFQGQTTVAQLVMVPLQTTHSANGVIESDRMLMVSGSLAVSSFGNASTALFDGQSFIPYFVSTSPSGLSGAVLSLFHSFASFSFSHRRVLAAGIVILISIAIAAGVVFLLGLVGILWTLFSRRDDKLNKLDAGEEEDDDSAHHRPSSLLEHINAATRTTILGSSPFSNINAEKEEEKTAKETQDPFGPDASNYIRAETPSDAVGGMMAEETSRPAHARYSFDGTGEGELPISTGAEVEVLDDRDPAWWYARDVRTGREGVVPAAYLY